MTNGSKALPALVTFTCSDFATLHRTSTTTAITPRTTGSTPKMLNIDVTIISTRLLARLFMLTRLADDRDRYGIKVICMRSFDSLVRFAELVIITVNVDNFEVILNRYGNRINSR